MMIMCLILTPLVRRSDADLLNIALGLMTLPESECTIHYTLGPLSPLRLVSLLLGELEDCAEGRQWPKMMINCIFPVQYIPCRLQCGCLPDISACARGGTANFELCLAKH